MDEPKHYRDVLVAFYQDEHHHPTADSTLNELHQHGWKLVRRDEADPVVTRLREEAGHALRHVQTTQEAVRRHWERDAELSLGRAVAALMRALDGPS